MDKESSPGPARNAVAVHTTALGEASYALERLEHELAEAERRASHWQERYKEVEELLRIQRDLKLESERRCAELENDAGRYRWMREHWVYANGIIFFDGFQLGPFDSLDAAIDAALAAREEKP